MSGMLGELFKTFQQGGNWIAEVTTLGIAVAPCVAIVIKFATVIGCSQIELAFMTRHEKTKHMTYSYLLFCGIVAFYEFGMAYLVGNLICSSQILELISICLFVIGVVAFVILSFLSNREGSIKQKISTICFWVCMIGISAMNTCLGNQLIQAKLYTEVILLTVFMSFILTIAFYYISWKVYKVDLAKVFYRAESGEAMYIFMADGKGNVYVGQKEVMSSFGDIFQLKSISSFEEEQIQIHKLNSMSRYLLEKNRWDDLIKAENDEQFRKEIELKMKNENKLGKAKSEKRARR